MENLKRDDKPHVEVLKCEAIWQRRISIFQSENLKRDAQPHVNLSKCEVKSHAIES